MLIKTIRIILFFALSAQLVACGGSGSGGSGTSDRNQAGTAYDFRSADYGVDTECESDMPDTFFQPHLTGFDLDNAYMLLLTTLLSEQETEVALSQFKSWGFFQVKDWNHTGYGTRVYIAEHQSFVLVVFRGTTEPVEIVSNAIFITEETDIEGPDGPGRAHAGIWDVHRRTREDIHKLLMAVNDKDKPVIFAGHSRGGAFTVLQAAYFQQRNAGDIETVYTFAQPRLGDRNFSEGLDALIGDRYFRIEFERDVTPRVPPSADMAQPLYEEGYIPLWLANTVESLNYDYDPGEAYILNEAGYLDPDYDSYQTQLSFWRDLFDRFPNLVLSIPRLIEYFPENHHPRVYICKLANAL
ncbi:MAG: lipase family protein [Ketobacteraceae bacterium]|nr:lipase family protein [Ketobacteraceae bacterium]